MTSSGEQDGHTPRRSFVGRERELAKVRASLADVTAGWQSISKPEIALHVQVVQIVPELRPAHGYEPRGSQVDLGTARFRLFDAMANPLKQFARVAPMLVLIDDPHDADQASLARLSFIAGELHDASIVILALAGMRRQIRYVGEEPIHEMGIPEGVRDVIGRRFPQCSGTEARAALRASVVRQDYR